MFIGISALNLDGKGRMTVPARHRDVLMARSQGRLTLTKSPDGCLMLFSDDEWVGFRDKVMQLPMAAQGWRRILRQVRDYRDLSPALLGRVEELVDFVTVGDEG